MRELVDKELSTVLFQNGYVKISIYRDLSLLTVIWQRQIFLDERIAGYQMVFELVKENQVKNLLVDNSNLFLFSEEEKRWVVQTFNTWVQATKLQKFALVTSDEYKNLVNLSEFIEVSKQEYQFLNTVAHEFFTDYETALWWVKEPLLRSTASFFLPN